MRSSFRDLDTGTQLASFKQCSAPVNGLALLGADYFIASQQHKDALHVYSWFKACPRSHRPSCAGTRTTVCKPIASLHLHTPLNPTKLP